MPNRSRLILLAVLASGCGASAPQGDTSALRAAEQSKAAQARAADDAAAEAKAAEVRELESKLALAQAKARDLERELSRSGEFRRDTVRIGSLGSSVESEEGWSAPVVPTKSVRKDDGPRPLLRLYGSGSNVSISTGGGADRETPPLIVPPAPEGVPTRLDVVPLPGASAASLTSMQPSAVPMATATIPGVAIPRLGGEDLATERYRSALAYIRDRKFGPALKSLHEFLVKYPTHAYADNALYWKGEVQYAQRQYGEALATFEDLVGRFPKGNKAADAVLKMALCHQHMGDALKARLYFKRVKELYPDSVAARVASQENRP